MFLHLRAILFVYLYGKTFDYLTQNTCMKMFRSIILTAVCAVPLLLTQCKSKDVMAGDEVQGTNEIVQNMEMRNPAFAKATTTFYKWMAGVQGGGSGITMVFDWRAMPENLVMKDAYFRGLVTSIKQDQKGYSANFVSDENGPKDLIMHSDPEEEAANTPPVKKAAFPVKLTNKQVGIVYEENGQLVYTIINNPTEKPQVAYPSAPPRGEGY